MTWCRLGRMRYRIRRSFPLMIKYPPNSSASSPCFTSSSELIPLKLHLTDCRDYVVSENAKDVKTATRKRTYANHDWHKTTVFHNWLFFCAFDLPAQFDSHSSSIWGEPFSWLRSHLDTYDTNNNLPTSEGYTNSFASLSADLFCLSDTWGRAIDTCWIHTEFYYCKILARPVLSWSNTYLSFCCLGPDFHPHLPVQYSQRLLAGLYPLKLVIKVPFRPHLQLTTQNRQKVHWRTRYAGSRIHLR